MAAELGYVDRAFEYLGRALQDRDSFLLLVPTERCLEPMRRDARYAELLRRMNLSTALAKHAAKTTLDPT
jgi:hypothetical protein